MWFRVATGRGFDSSSSRPPHFCGSRASPIDVRLMRSVSSWTTLEEVFNKLHHAAVPGSQCGLSRRPKDRQPRRQVSLRSGQWLALLPIEETVQLDALVTHAVLGHQCARVSGSVPPSYVAPAGSSSSPGSAWRIFGGMATRQPGASMTGRHATLGAPGHRRRALRPRRSARR